MLDNDDITSIFDDNSEKTADEENIAQADVYEYNIRKTYRLLPTECSCGCREKFTLAVMWELRRGYGGYGGSVTEKDYFSVSEFPTRDSIQKWLTEHKW